MIAIKSRGNKDNKIQFVLNPEIVYFQIGKSNVGKISFSLGKTSH